MCLSGIAIKLPEGEYDTEPEEKVHLLIIYYVICDTICLYNTLLKFRNSKETERDVGIRRVSQWAKSPKSL